MPEQLRNLRSPTSDVVGSGRSWTAWIVLGLSGHSWIWGHYVTGYGTTKLYVVGAKLFLYITGPDREYLFEAVSLFRCLLGKSSRHVIRLVLNFSLLTTANGVFIFFFHFGHRPQGICFTASEKASLTVKILRRCWARGERTRQAVNLKPEKRSKKSKRPDRRRILRLGGSNSIFLFSLDSG